jgi:ribonuclease P protein subunit POP4
MIHAAEFIGAKIKVINATNKSLQGLEGSIIDETKNSFKIKNSEQEEKIVLKKGAVFMINNNIIKGDEIIKRPEERIKLRK